MINRGAWSFLLHKILSALRPDGLFSSEGAARLITAAPLLEAFLSIGGAATLLLISAAPPIFSCG